MRRAAHPPPTRPSRFLQNDLGTVGDGAELACVAQNSANRVRGAGGLRAIIRGGWRGAEKDAKCLARRPVRQLAHVHPGAGIWSGLLADGNPKVDFVAPVSSSLPSSPQPDRTLRGSFTIQFPDGQTQLLEPLVRNRMSFLVHDNANGEVKHISFLRLPPAHHRHVLRDPFYLGPRDLQ